MKTYLKLFGLQSLLIFVFSAATMHPNHESQVSGSNNGTKLQPKLTVSGTRVTEIKSNQAKCSFTVQGTPVTEKGVCYSDVSGPTIAGKKAVSPSNPANSGTAILAGLKPGTTYYVKAYAKSGNEVFYGAETSFKTSEQGDKNSNQNTGKKVESKPAQTKG